MLTEIVARPDMTRRPAILGNLVRVRDFRLSAEGPTDFK
jgi:hypothetical protein